MSKRGGLGRGLSALIPGAPEAGETSTGLLEVPAGAIAPNPKQPRSRFDDETLAELAASIREVGILQPIVVRRAGQGYEVVTGERRLRAAKLAGLATVPVVLRDSDDADLLREALIENIHREDLNPIELGEAFRQLLDELGLKQEELADRVGVSRSHIANTIRLLALPLEVQQLLTDEKLSAAMRGRSSRWATRMRSRRCRCGSRPRTCPSARPRRSFDGSSRVRRSPLRRRRPIGRGPADPNLAEVEEILSEQLATRVRDPDGAEARSGRDRVRLRRRPREDRVRDRRLRSRPRPRLSDAVIQRPL